MVIEAINKETETKWAIKKVNKEKVRLIISIILRAELGGVSGQYRFYTNTPASDLVGGGQGWSPGSVGISLAFWERTSSKTQVDKCIWKKQMKG